MEGKTLKSKMSTFFRRGASDQKEDEKSKSFLPNDVNIYFINSKPKPKTRSSKSEGNTLLSNRNLSPLSWGRLPRFHDRS